MDHFTSTASSPAEGYENGSAQTASGTIDLAKQTGRAAIDSGKTFAKNAVNAAGERLSNAKIQLDQATEKGTKYVTQQPVRAVAMAAAGGAILGLLLGAMRSRR